MISKRVLELIFPSSIKQDPDFRSVIRITCNIQLFMTHLHST